MSASPRSVAIFCRRSDRFKSACHNIDFFNELVRCTVNVFSVVVRWITCDKSDMSESSKEKGGEGRGEGGTLDLVRFLQQAHASPLFR